MRFLINKKRRNDMKKSGIILLISIIIIIALAGCNLGGKTEEEKISQLEKEGRKYLAEDAVISDEPPAEGYHSPKEALLNTAKMFKEQGDLNIEKDGKTREWLLDCKVQEPVLVHNFVGAKKGKWACAYYYYIYAEHPEKGLVSYAVYEYNENSEKQYGVSMERPPRLPNGDKKLVRLEKDEAKSLVEERSGVKGLSDPIAAWIPMDMYSDETCYLWYFETAENSRGGHQEFLVDPAVVVGKKVTSSRAILNKNTSRFFPEHAAVVKLTEHIHLKERAKGLGPNDGARSSSDLPPFKGVSREDMKPLTE